MVGRQNAGAAAGFPDSDYRAAGAKLQPFSAQMLEAAFVAANSVYAEFTAKNANFKKIWESQLAFRKDGVLWFRVAENTYDNFMARQSAAEKL